MHADGKSTLASVSKWNSGKVNSYALCLLGSDSKAYILGAIVGTLREDQPLITVKLITRTALYSVSKET